MSVNEKKFNHASFKTKFGSLINEFKQDRGFAGCLYYPLFLLRRLEYVLVQIFLNEYPLIQVSLNTIFTFGILIFLLIYRPFKDKTALIGLFSSEIAIFIVFFSSGFFLLYPKQKVVQLIESVCIYCILASIGVQLIISMYNFGKQMQFWFKKLEKKRAVQFLKNSNQVLNLSNIK